MIEKHNRQRLLVIVAIAAVGLLIADKLILTPLAGLWRERSDRITELETKIRLGRILVERQESIQGRWNEMNAQSLPPDLPVAENEVLKAVNRWAETSGISFTSIKPQWREMEGGYRTLQCRASAFGSMDRVARFLYELETDPLAVHLEEVEISARDEKGAQLGLDLRFTGVVLKKPNS